MVKSTTAGNNAVSSLESTDSKKSRKEKSREKEHRRAQCINSAFEILQQHIPYLKSEERKSLPKIKTLRLAMQYIDHLKKLLGGNEMLETDCNESRPLTHSDFRVNISNEIRIRNSYRERAHNQELDEATVKRILAREDQRRRCSSVPEGIQRYTPYQSRQFGPISNNVCNFRHVDANQYNTNFMEYQTQMVQVANFPNQFSHEYYNYGTFPVIDPTSLENSNPILQ